MSLPAHLSCFCLSVPRLKNYGSGGQVCRETDVFVPEEHKERWRSPSSNLMCWCSTHWYFKLWTSSVNSYVEAEKLFIPRVPLSRLFHIPPPKDLLRCVFETLSSGIYDMCVCVSVWVCPSLPLCNTKGQIHSAHSNKPWLAEGRQYSSSWGEPLFCELSCYYSPTANTHIHTHTPNRQTTLPSLLHPLLSAINGAVV